VEKFKPDLENQGTIRKFALEDFLDTLEGINSLGNSTCVALTEKTVFASCDVFG